ncbi:MAG: tRNA uridine-5-carboxymethylaminomethyl(34) synthesis enzyme MnmG [Bacteroidales bacterium]|nr:tRNA uridine-5-carboxymethylaminomethyl(34) synthesis enzyme MnmG [Candidatus Cloacimonadota bacterium]MDD2203702.1 tRNA uridine-5-carboxymethylaminomethyl(34) synthesis enzyme MnmG [Bacteroidales bacterium]MDD3151950.1 tRNA uridine-5-carboxymethylaminomethyl(34) synthesis enzyme MnmG [Bacteroidales bacterium]MDD3914965.1 tRNA uridine-5-carboxymethylaminomethyl(34) synthesis enzyme MnmG [Bacteroidales bacterium]MDD4634841.1 tRNA uridine-5-carboxymethylaminomethyl(34) synthesis enzyme MnmG [B
MFSKYDIIVVGAGHAGCEAAAAAANLGSKTLLISMNMDLVAQMSCNPAIGGVAKGQIVREIDALGGYTGIVADKSMIQFRMLNKSKGPAMWSPRTQNDRMLFSYHWLRTLETIKNLDFISDNVIGLIIDNYKIIGIKTITGKHIYSDAVILTNGTFLNGKIHIGEVSFSGGRIGESNSVGISEELREDGFEVDTLKTGTPVRIDGRSIDYSVLVEQQGDAEGGKFSYTDTPKIEKQRSCYIAYTSPEVHETLKKGFDKSPLFQGRIKGKGPRYCPSIEDKLIRFADKDKHQLFVEPEGWNTVEVYLNGFSSSLPEEIQYEAIRKIKGFENAKFIKPGYAIEYDYFPPTQLKNTLETKQISNLYFAGQINGTTGYEEAACQGLIVGINAHLRLKEKEPFVLSRSEAYIGVLIDDLITKGINEPYRMFTSRAEHRILLRQDNADIRLTPKSFEIGLASQERYNKVVSKIEKTNDLISFINVTSTPSPDEINDYLSFKDSSCITEKCKLSKLILRPDIHINEICEYSQPLKKHIEEISADEETIEQAEINIKYEGYIVKEKQLAEKLRSIDNMPLKTNLDYFSMTNLSYESREKLSKIKPTSIGQASRISGVSPSDIAALMVLLGI